MAKTKIQQGGWNAARVLQAIGRIGYRPEYAVLDIVDNSVSAKATKVVIKVDREQEKREGPGRRRAIISSFCIIDNGDGMNEKELENAIKLGSSESYYPTSTLSKFGMGLKSAAFSLGARLEIISCPKTAPNSTRKVCVDSEVISQTEGGEKYMYNIEDPNTEEIEDLRAVADGGGGTMICVRKIHSESLPSVSEILDKLKRRAGVVYSYYLDGKVPGSKPLEMWIDGSSVEAIDPLFENEAQKSLDELEWDGLGVSWIIKEQRVQFDPQGKIHGIVRVAQLPHPPSVEYESSVKRSVTRKKYSIEAANYGFYIYRNYRMISWADSLGIVPQEKELYSFRGKLLIASDSDDLLNIDVTKSRIHLSQIATDQLKPVIREAVRKSREAWKRRTRILSSKTTEDAHSDINAAIDKAAETAERDDKIDEEVASPNERKQLEKRRKRIGKRKPVEKEEAIKLEGGERVQYVDSLANNQLWDYAVNADGMLVARVNESHRLIREVISLLENSELTKLFETLLFSLARGEYKLKYQSEFDVDTIEGVMEEYRERVGGELSELLRKMDLAALFGNV